MAGIVAKVATGAVDAGFVYSTDVRGAGGRLIGIELPGRLQPKVVYGAAVVKGAPIRPRRTSSSRACSRRRSARARRGRASATRSLSRAGFSPFCSGSSFSSRCAVTLAFLTLPVAAIFVDVGPGELLSRLDDPASLDALRLSLETTLIALAVILAVGTPAAYLLATRSFRGRAVVLTLIELPLILPPAAAGVGLLAALGPNGIAGSALESIGIRLPLTTAGVVVALVFVASPFYLRQATAAFGALDPALLEASSTLGAPESRTFARVAVPLSLPSLATGAALAWGRALGEFGATLMFAGSFRGVTQTATLPGQLTANGARRRTGPILPRCSGPRRPRVCRSSSRSDTGGCLCRRSRSTAAPRP